MSHANSSTDASIRAHDGGNPDSSSDPSVEDLALSRGRSKESNSHTYFLKKQKILNLGYMNVKSKLVLK